MRLVRRSLMLGALISCVYAASASAALPKRITFYFGLTRPEAQARQAFFAVQQPGSSTYRRFLSPGGVAARYGASPAVRAAFTRAVQRRGFSVRIDPTGVFARVTGTVARFEQVFKTRITHDISSGSGLPVYVFHATRPLRLPADLRPLVDDLVPDFQQEFRAPRAETAAATGPTRTGTWKAGCAKAKATGAFSYAQVRHAGPTNGLFYYLRRHQPAAFYDIVHGNNALVPGIPGYSAKPGYDLASGLGVPQFAWIARHLPPPAPGLSTCSRSLTARTTPLKSSGLRVARDC